MNITKALLTKESIDENLEKVKIISKRAIWRYLLLSEMNTENLCMLIGSFAVNGKTWMEGRGTGTLLFGGATEGSVIKLKGKIGYVNSFCLNLIQSFTI